MYRRCGRVGEHDLNGIVEDGLPRRKRVSLAGIAASRGNARYICVQATRNGRPRQGLCRLRRNSYRGDQPQADQRYAL